MLYLLNCCFLVVIECPPPPNITNGTISYSPPDTDPNYSLGTNATYTCSNGYFLKVNEGMDKVRKCEDDDGMDDIGVWSGQPPTCVRELSIMINILLYLL